MTDFSYIKLIIWDLDDTLWKGTLSEGDVLLSDKIVTLIKRLTDCGIVNSICSKNDKAIVEQKLQELHLLDYFVFNSIDWTPKGTRIKSILDNIGLRAENTLFIDDNMVNLNEARYYEPNIHIAEPAILQDLIHYYNSVEAKDLEHSRLKSYRVLEQKQISKSQYSDNTAFLFSTNTRVEIKKDCLQHLDRIEELVNRTNQLNYTKRRCSRDELSQLLSDTTVDAGYVVVEDNFGKYGIVGFYAIKNNECIHFLFSCRTIGQGVEQYVYSILNFPNISVVGDVIVDLKRIPAPQWINQKNHSCRENRKRKLSGKVLFKGPCDLSSMVLNFDSSSILTEFTYIGEHQNSIEHHNHSVNYLRFPFLSQIERDELQTECMFNDVQMFDTELFNQNLRDLLDGKEVKHDATKCIFCGHCMAVCPKEVLWIDGDGYDIEEVEEYQFIQKTMAYQVRNDIITRRSVRSFNDQAVSTVKLNKILEVAKYATLENLEYETELDVKKEQKKHFILPCSFHTEDFSFADFVAYKDNKDRDKIILESDNGVGAFNRKTLSGHLIMYIDFKGPLKVISKYVGIKEYNMQTELFVVWFQAALMQYIGAIKKQLDLTGVGLPFDINADGLLERGRQLMDRVEDLKGTKSHWSNFYYANCWISWYK